jgi:O-antigen biosynthesis protein
LDRCVDAARRAIGEHLAAKGYPDAEVRLAPAARWWTRVQWPLPDPAPRVSVIIPTRDRPELLDRVLTGLLQRTDYPDYEVVLVDNGSTDPLALTLMEQFGKDRRVVTVRAPGPFNFSSLINAGVAAATGTVLVFLNNDVDVIDHGWLRELASQAIRPEIGAVGTKLLFPDTTVQFAGTVLGVGNPLGGPGIADHFGVHAVRRDVGYFGFLALARRVSAVTAACMAMRREVFDAVGGMDAENLAVAYNDVDLCLRIRERGLDIVWTPFAEMFHFESATRGADHAPDKVARFNREWDYMRRRWAERLDNDPYLNPNFGWGANTFQYAFPPRRPKRWSPFLTEAAAASQPAAEAEESRFVDWLPAPANAARLFEGEWSSAVPGLPSGPVNLFEDPRVQWFEERLGGFAGRRVLELGPLEGGHTFMMARGGAEVLAIESNKGAFLRCLIAKETVGMPKARFLLGDFRKYLSR